MVAAAIFSRHGPASRSAARRKIAARSSNGVAAQCARAAIAASTAAVASAWSALVSVPSVAACRCGCTTSIRSPLPMRCAAADDMRQVDRVIGQRAECDLQPAAFGRIRRIIVDRLVGGQRNIGDRVHALRMPADDPPELGRSDKAEPSC